MNPQQSRHTCPPELSYTDLISEIEVQKIKPFPLGAICLAARLFGFQRYEDANTGMGYYNADFAWMLIEQRKQERAAINAGKKEGK